MFSSADRHSTGSFATRADKASAFVHAWTRVGP
jgi:hypothetical protein